MRGKIILLFLFILSMLAPIQVSAQKVKLHNFREARNYLKNNKKGEVDKIIKKLTPADSIEKKYLTGMINQYSIEQSNVNVYWGTKVDTANVFKTVYSMYENYYASYLKSTFVVAVLGYISTIFFGFWSYFFCVLFFLSLSLPLAPSVFFKNIYLPHH